MNATEPRVLGLPAMPRDPRAATVRTNGLRAIEISSWLRGLVLGQRDLAAALTQPPIGYERADQWNGFVPSQMTVLPLRREALRALCIEAIRRTHGDADAEAWELVS